MFFALIEIQIYEKFCVQHESWILYFQSKAIRDFVNENPRNFCDATIIDGILKMDLSLEFTNILILLNYVCRH
jgi:hypothetical protein